MQVDACSDPGDPDPATPDGAGSRHAGTDRGMGVGRPLALPEMDALSERLGGGATKSSPTRAGWVCLGALLYWGPSRARSEDKA